MKKIPEPFSADECRERLQGADIMVIAKALEGLALTTLYRIRDGKTKPNYGTRALLTGYWKRVAK